MLCQAEISRRNPTAFLFVIDQSGSMNDPWGDYPSKAVGVSDALNRILWEMILKCSKNDGVRGYFDIGVIGYHDNQWQDGLGFLHGPLFKSIKALSTKSRRIETRIKMVSDGLGGLVEKPVKFPIWFMPVAEGNTPMCMALRVAGQQVGEWCNAHPHSYPPTIIHITDGEPTDGNPEEVTALIAELGTQVGSVLLFNMHISSQSDGGLLFPDCEQKAPDAAARLLFRMSSPLPEALLYEASKLRYNIAPGARGYCYNAAYLNLVDFFTIGTQAANIAR